MADSSSKDEKPPELMDPRLEGLRKRIIDESFWGQVKQRLIPIAGDIAAVGLALGGVYFGFPLPAVAAATAIGAGGHILADLTSIQNDEGKEFDKMHAQNLSFHNTRYDEEYRAKAKMSTLAEQAEKASQAVKPLVISQAAPELLPSPLTPALNGDYLSKSATAVA